MSDPLKSIKNVLYATGMIQEMARMTPPGSPGSPEHTRFVALCCDVFGVTPSQVEEAITEPSA